MSDESTPLVLEIDLKEHGERFNFANPEELAIFSRDEMERWNWLSAYGDPFSRYRNVLNELDGSVEQWRRSKDNPERVQSLLAGLKSQIEGSYGTGNPIHSSSVHGKFIQGIRTKFGEAAGYGAYSFLLQPHNPPLGQHCTPSALRGIIEAYRYTHGDSPLVETHDEELNALRVKYQNNIAEQALKLGELEKQNKELNDAFAKVLEAKASALDELHKLKHTALDELRNSQGSEFANLMQKSADELDDVKKTYDARLALQQPVKYWEEVCAKHQVRAGIFTVLLCSAAVGFGFGMYNIVRGMLADLKPGEDPRHWQLGVVLTCAFIGIWTLRVLLRLVMSNIHLATDAAERRTMILTYISLMREGKEVSPTDKELIMKHIFRTASDGIVKDDTGPPGIFGWFTQK